MPLLELRDISKSFSRQPVLQDLTLQIEPSERVVLVGQSGCGKTTLLRLIAGLDRPDCGEIVFDSNSWNDIPAHRRDVGMVFQQGGYYEQFNVRKNLEASLVASKLSRRELADRVDWVVDLLGLADWLTRRPHELSGGQLQRLILARGIIKKPRLLLLDEPLRHLDPWLRFQMRELLLRLHSQLQMAYLFVTHDSLEALSMSQRLAVLSQGKISSTGAPNQLYRAPESVAVAELISPLPMRFYAGSLVHQNGPTHLRLFGRTWELEASDGRRALDQVDEANDVLCGTYPEDWHIMPMGSSDSQSEKGEVILRVQIQYVQCMGRTYYVSSRDEHGYRIDALVNASSPECIATETYVTMRINIRDIHFFPSSSRESQR